MQEVLNDPLGDADRRPLRYPVVTTMIILINVVVFAIELIGGEAFIPNGNGKDGW
jgi:hypothetical protein